MAPSQTCAGCTKKISDVRDSIKCSTCSLTYDLECANVTPKRLHSMAKDKLSWKCPKCKSSEPKVGNSNTPVRGTVTNEDSFVTQRQPQKHKQSEDAITSESQAISEPLLLSIRKEIRTSLINTISEVISPELNIIKEKLTSFEDALNFFNTAYEDMKGRLEEKEKIIESMQKEQSVLQSVVKDLGYRLRQVEQHTRETNIEINGVPEIKSECLKTLSLQLAKTIKCELTSEDIFHTSRIAKQAKEDGQPRTILLKLKDRNLRASMISSIIKFNRHQNPKLNTHHLGYGGAAVPVYVSEHLSPANKQLHAATRKKAKQMGFKFVWVKDGRIFVRKDEKSAAIHIRDLESIELIC